MRKSTVFAGLLGAIAMLGAALVPTQSWAQALGQCNGTGTHTNPNMAMSLARGNCKAQCPAGTSIITGCIGGQNTCANGTCTVTCTCFR